MRARATLLAVLVLVGPVVGVAWSAGPQTAATTSSTPCPPGCGSPEQRGLERPADGYDIEVKGGTLPFDVNVTFARVERLVGRNVTPPDVIHLKEDFSWDAPSEASPFERLLGFETRRVTYWAAALSDKVIMNPALQDQPVLAEAVLAHEFAHLAQYATTPGPGVDIDAPTFDQRQANNAVVEGAASVVAQAYWDRYLQEPPSPAAFTRETYVTGTPMGKLNEAPYWFGYRYVNRTVASPAEAVTAHLSDEPTTTEELLHGPDEIAPLEVSVRPSDDWGHELRSARGEMFLRVALRTGLDRDAARRAAAGWGNDTLVAFNGSSSAFAWVIRWDDAANATEFEQAIEAYLTARSDAGWRDRADRYRFVRTDERTTVLLMGPRAFVENTTVEGSGASVTVDPPGEASTPTPTETPSPTPRATSPPVTDTGQPSTRVMTSPAPTGTTSPGPGPFVAAGAVVVALLWRWSRR